MYQTIPYVLFTTSIKTLAFINGDNPQDSADHFWETKKGDTETGAEEAECRLVNKQIPTFAQTCLIIMYVCVLSLSALASKVYPM
jgi:hypothetical protein